MKPDAWSVVVIGRWNPAILTPAGVNKHVFKLEEGKQFPVQVALDGVSSYRIGLPEEDIFVISDRNQLLFDIVQKKLSTLDKAKSLAVNAIRSLPETPVVAAGWNINCSTEDLSTPMQAIMSDDIDNSFSDEGFTIVSRLFGRSFEFGSGVINMQITRAGSRVHVGCNFHKKSKSNEELIEWLNTPIEEVTKALEKIYRILGKQLQEED